MITAKFENITPKLAKQYLETMGINRSLRNDWISQIKRDILNNDWAETGDSIRFHKNGKLVDGNHRLNAIIATKKNIKIISNSWFR